MTSQAQQQQTELDAARAALDASYRADLADPAYGPYMRISQRTHRLWLVWSQLQLAQPIKQVQSIDSQS
jgi:hypothetical protein